MLGRAMTKRRDQSTTHPAFLMRRLHSRLFDPRDSWNPRLQPPSSLFLFLVPVQFSVHTSMLSPYGPFADR